MKKLLKEVNALAKISFLQLQLTDMLQLERNSSPSLSMLLTQLSNL